MFMDGASGQISGKKLENQQEITDAFNGNRKTIEPTFGVKYTEYKRPIKNLTIGFDSKQKQVDPPLIVDFEMQGKNYRLKDPKKLTKAEYTDICHQAYNSAEAKNIYYRPSRNEFDTPEKHSRGGLGTKDYDSRASHASGDMLSES